MGLSGNLTTGEILEQIVHADRILAKEYEELQSRHTGDQPLPKVDLVRNVVFMGMGEVSWWLVTCCCEWRVLGQSLVFVCSITLLNQTYFCITNAAPAPGAG